MSSVTSCMGGALFTKQSRLLYLLACALQYRYLYYSCSWACRIVLQLECLQGPWRGLDQGPALAPCRLFSCHK
jgi:hypothetical protein